MLGCFAIVAGMVAALRLFMDEHEFYKLCLGEYRFEKTETGALYQRAGVLLVALPLLGTVCYKLGRIDLIPRVFERVDIFIYYVATTISFLSLSVSAFFLYMCIFPRGYPSLASMKKWQDWRDKYKERLASDKKQSINQKERLIGKEMLRSVIPLLADAQAGCSSLNEKRRKQFRRSILAVGFAIIPIPIQALFRLLLHLQGI